MTELAGQPGELRMTLEITRAATGKTEIVELFGFGDLADMEKFVTEQKKEQGSERQP